MFTKSYPKTLFLFSIILVLALVTSGCGITINIRTVRGSGVISEQSFSVQGFHAISMGGIGEVTVEMGDEESLRIEAEDNLLEYFDVEVRNGTLMIEQSPTGITLVPTKPIHIYVTAQSLDALALSGLGNLSAPELTGEDCDLNTSGAGSITVESLDCTNLDVSITGLGDITVQGGQVDTQDVTISGMGGYQAGDLQSREADFQISGMGDSTIWVTESLIVSISGVGDLEYYGQPRVTTSGSGVGDVDSLGEK